MRRPQSPTYLRYAGSRRPCLATPSAPRDRGLFRQTLLGHAHAQRSRHDLEARGRGARLLAVELDGKRLVGVDLDDRSSQLFDLRVREVRALVDLPHVADEVRL